MFRPLPQRRRWRSRKCYGPEFAGHSWPGLERAVDRAIPELLEEFPAGSLIIAARSVLREVLNDGKFRTMFEDMGPRAQVSRIQYHMRMKLQKSSPLYASELQVEELTDWAYARAKELGLDADAYMKVIQEKYLEPGVVAVSHLGIEPEYLDDLLRPLISRDLGHSSLSPVHGLLVVRRVPEPGCHS